MSASSFDYRQAFEPEPPLALPLVRISVGILGCYIALALLPYAEHLIASNGLVGHGLPIPTGFSYVPIAAALVGALAILVGFRTRTAAAVTGLIWLVLYLTALFQLTVSTGVVEFFVLCFVLAFSRAGDRWSIDWIRRGRPKPSAASSVPRLLLCGYFAANLVIAGVWKTVDPAWRSGAALDFILQHESIATPLGRAVHAQLPASVLVAATFFGVVSEVVSPLLLIPRKTRLPTALFMGVYFAVMGLFTNPQTVQLPMTITALCFLQPWLLRRNPE